MFFILFAFDYYFSYNCTYLVLCIYYFNIFYILNVILLCYNKC